MITILLFLPPAAAESPSSKGWEIVFQSISPPADSEKSVRSILVSLALMHAHWRQVSCQENVWRYGTDGLGRVWKIDARTPQVHYSRSPGE